MKNLLLSILIVFISCDSANEAPTNETNNENNNNQNEVVTDTYKIVTANSEGKIFEIGNNTGTINQIGQITTQDNLLMLTSFINFNTKIICKEANIPLANVIYEYDKATNTTSTINITIPSSVTSTMNEPFLAQMTFDGNSILAVVNENLPNSTHPSKIVAIDPETYTITDLEISFYQVGITSLVYANDKLYMSSLNNGILEVDLNLKTVTQITTTVGASTLAKIDNTTLSYTQLGGTNWVNACKPFEINLTNNVVTDKSQNTFYSLGNIYSNGFCTDEEVLNLVFKQTNQFGLLKLNYTTNEVKFVAINQNSISVNAVIIDKKNL
ncbi:hypothetical protein [Flavobacterium sp.]|uniref:hypothetical protein n=1 Tax=Flavobacterium sp. TaxID=239 RepID=UPI0035295936